MVLGVSGFLDWLWLSTYKDFQAWELCVSILGVCMCVYTAYMSATYLGTDSKPAYFLGIISEECSSLGMDKKPSDIPIGCSPVALRVRWNSWHFAFWQWIYLKELTWGLNFTLLLRPQVAETHSGSLRTGCAMGVGDGQGALVYCSPWGGKELDMTEWLNWTKLLFIFQSLMYLSIIYC